MCRGCDELILPVGSPFFEFIHEANASDPRRKCLCCADCFGKLHAARGCSPSFSCLCCKRNVIGHHCWKWTVQKTRTSTKVSQETKQQPAVYIAGPKQSEDPGRYFSAQDDSVKSTHVLLSAQWIVEEPHKQCRSLVVEVPYLEPCDSYTDEVKSNLVSFMTLLYHVFFHPEYSEDGVKHSVLKSIDCSDLFAQVLRRSLSGYNGRINRGRSFEKIVQ